LVQRTLDPTALGALGPILENVRDKGEAVLLDQLLALKVKKGDLNALNAVRRKTSDQAFKEMDNAAQILIQEQAQEAALNYIDLVNSRSPDNLQREIAGRVVDDEPLSTPFVFGSVAGASRIGARLMASGRGGRGPKISVGEAIGILLSALGLARSGGDAGGPSDAATPTPILRPHTRSHWHTYGL
jgi:hypothetical protein